MSYRLLFILSLLMAAFQAQAAYNEHENHFYDKSTEQFTAYVGMFSSRSGYIRFADAEVPHDPNTPVLRAYDITDQMSGDIEHDGSYYFTIEGPDAAMFTAHITSMSASENGCTVLVTYHPTQAGSHTARLNVICENAGAPLTYINLCGEGIARPGDVDGDGSVGISDVSSLIDMLLRE